MFNLAGILTCRHRNYTFPQTPRNKTRGNNMPYVCCLDCGREFPYDWKAMKIVTKPRPALTLIPKAPCSAS